MEFPFIPYNGECSTAQCKPLRTNYTNLLNSDIEE